MHNKMSLNHLTNLKLDQYFSAISYFYIEKHNSICKFEIFAQHIQLCIHQHLRCQLSSNACQNIELIFYMFNLT